MAAKRPPAYILIKLANGYLFHKAKFNVEFAKVDCQESFLMMASIVV
ncbi:hypothetical protein NMD12_10910 [Citrobacter portucalensis]